MKIIYSEKIDYFYEAALLISGKSAKLSGDYPACVDYNEQLKAIKKHYNVSDETAQKLDEEYYTPLKKLSDDVLSGIDLQGFDKFYFEPCFEEIVSVSMVLAAGVEYADTLKKDFSELSDNEYKTAQLIMAGNIASTNNPFSEKLQSSSIYEIIENGLRDDSQKWTLYKTVSNAKQYIAELQTILAPVIVRLKAHEKTLLAMSKRCLQEIKEYLDAQNGTIIDFFSLRPDASYPITISAAVMWPNTLSLRNSPDMQYVSVGILFKQMNDILQKHTMSEEILIATLKLLGDKSRIEILKLLKQRPHYGNEMAQSLSLTPATISHHMTTLMNCRVVSMEQQGAKTLFSINTEEIAGIIRALETTLL